MSYKILMFDFDDTLFDFQKAEKYAFKKLISAYNIEYNEDIYQTYHKINLDCWHQLEKNLITRSEVIEKRFIEFFKIFNIQIDPTYVNSKYFDYLTENVYYKEDALEVIQYLQKKYVLIGITNGFKTVQQRRINQTNFSEIFSKIYISEEIKFSKPAVEFFEYIEKDFPIENKREILIIGDSESSDMLGGINYNVDTCWFNEKNAQPKNKYTYIIRKLKDLYQIL